MNKPRHHAGFTASPASSNAPYILAVVILTALAAILVITILWLRPKTDALDAVAQVAKGLAPTIAGVMAYLKSQETHLSVNSRLDAFIRENAKVAHREGQLQGIADERARRDNEEAAPAPEPQHHDDD
jgi:hypothetical protein